MTHVETADAVAPQRIDRISISQRTGVFRVSVNGAFYGDYTRKYWPLEAAFEEADRIASSGDAATISWAIDGEQDTLLYDTRSPPRREKAKRTMRPPKRRRRAAGNESFAWRVVGGA